MSTRKVISSSLISWGKGANGAALVIVLMPASSNIWEPLDLILLIPPLIITPEQLAEGFAVLDEALGISDQAVKLT